MASASSGGWPKSYHTEGKYILDDEGNPVPCYDLLTWAKWFESDDGREARCVSVTEIKDGISVSTAFMGMDHSFGDGTLPILYETMVFGGPLAGTEQRYSTRQEAIEGHNRIVTALLNNEQFL